MSEFLPAFVLLSNLGFSSSPRSSSLLAFSGINVSTNVSKFYIILLRSEWIPNTFCAQLLMQYLPYVAFKIRFLSAALFLKYLPFQLLLISLALFTFCFYRHGNSSIWLLLTFGIFLTHVVYKTRHVGLVFVSTRIWRFLLIHSERQLAHLHTSLA